MKKILVLCLGLMVSGCFTGTTKESRFYALKSEQVVEITYQTPPISIDVENVRIPASIDKPQIVTMNANDVEFTIHELDRWSEPLEFMIAGTLADDMALYLPKATVKNGGDVFETFTYTVSVDVIKFIGNGKEATLDAWWTVRDRDERKIGSGRSTYTENIGSNYVDFVTAQSKMVSLLARDISKKIATLK